MAMDTNCAAEVRWQADFHGRPMIAEPVSHIGIADAANSWRVGFKSRAEADWLSASILHDLRNPVGTIYAGAEMLVTLDTIPNQVKRLAANMRRAAPAVCWNC
jgi:hypothetical protein